MPRIFASLLCGLLLISCSQKDDNMTVKGTVDGLKKGTLYFQKFEDTTLVTLDSLVINGDPSFAFSTHVESPEVFYLYLEKADGNDFNDQFEFFGEPGEITINSSHDYFASEAVVEGSASHAKLKEYRKMMGQFSDKNLELIKASLEAGQKGKQELVDSLNMAIDRVGQRGYLYTLNFVFNNTDSYVAPYIALTELNALNTKYLDSINKIISPEVAASKYGKRLAEYVEEIKKDEAKTSAETAKDAAQEETPSANP